MNKSARTRNNAVTSAHNQPRYLLYLAHSDWQKIRTVTVPKN